MPVLTAQRRVAVGSLLIGIVGTELGSFLQGTLNHLTISAVLLVSGMNKILPNMISELDRTNSSVDSFKTAAKQMPKV